MKPTPWTDARKAQITELWSSGITAAQIAATMGGFDACKDGGRCAVLGQAHRMGLPPRGVRCLDLAELERREERARERKKERNRNRDRGRAVDAPAAVKPVSKPVAVWLGSLEIPMADLRRFSSTESNQCRYIAATDPAPLYLTCGNETEPGRSYCGRCHPILHYSREPQQVAA